ncbi:MAG: SecDF P1 head subdomain-containing protein [Luteolibacter sp.]
MLLRTGLFLLATCLLSQHAFAAGSKKGKAQVSFHLQAEPGDPPKMMYPLLVGGKQMGFKRMPEIQTNDVAGYKAVPSKKTQGIYDVIIQLKPNAAKRLQTITNANRGRFFAGQLNGRAGEAVMINETVNDGILVIWGVANAEDLKTLAAAFKGSVELE